MGNKLSVTYPIEPGTEGAVAITAIEGGIGYWAQADAYDPRRWTDPQTGDSLPVDEDFVFYVLREDPDDDGQWNGTAIEVTPALIRRGMQLYLTGVTEEQAREAQTAAHSGSSFQPRLFDDMDDLTCMDSDEADCVIQLGAFGALVYG